MTLLITIVAAVISTAVWYLSERARKLGVSLLGYMFWGASIMWFVDAIAEYIELGAEYFTPATADMINDAYLGFSVIAFALVIWILSVIIKDPMNVIRGKKMIEATNK